MHEGRLAAVEVLIASTGPLSVADPRWLEDWDSFSRFADRMLEEREFFARKAIGWILRESAKQRPQLVADWLERRAHRAAGLTVREAVEHLPEHDRGRVLVARAAR